MTKGFFNGGRSVSLHSLAQALKYDKQAKELKKKKKQQPKSKKIINKYKGD
jgi:hypothetical protein